MAGIYTYRLGIVSGAVAGLQPVFTVLDNQHVILRDLAFVNAGSIPAAVTWSVLSADGLKTTYIWSRTGITPADGDHLDLRQELRLGETLQVSSDVSNWSAMATGYVFQLK